MRRRGTTEGPRDPDAPTKLTRPQRPSGEICSTTSHAPIERIVKSSSCHRVRLNCCYVRNVFYYEVANVNYRKLVKCALKNTRQLADFSILSIGACEVVEQISPDGRCGRVRFVGASDLRSISSRCPAVVPRTLSPQIVHQRRC